MKKISFKSRYSFFLYFFIAFFICVAGFAIYKFIAGELDLPGLLFLILLSFLIGYLTIRFECQIILNPEYLKLRYVIPFKKDVHIDTSQIVEFDKHEDSARRIHKQIFIKTISESYLVSYNISEDSDEEFLTSLDELIDNKDPN